MHTLLDIRRALKSHRSLSDHYRQNPQTMLELNASNLLMSVQPLAFNALYYLTCTNQEAKEFVQNFTSWQTIDMKKYMTKEDPSQHYRTLQLLFDVLHHLDEKLGYPLHVMWSDLVATSKPTDLMDSMSRSRRCAAPSTYWDFRKKIANFMEQQKEAGDIPGIDPDVDHIAALHMDNLEQVQRYDYLLIHINEIIQLEQSLNQWILILRSFPLDALNIYFFHNPQAFYSVHN